VAWAVVCSLSGTPLATIEASQDRHLRERIPTGTERKDNAPGPRASSHRLACLPARFIRPPYGGLQGPAASTVELVTDGAGAPGSGHGRTGYR
jgi:hypothetical protein